MTTRTRMMAVSGAPRARAKAPASMQSTKMVAGTDGKSRERARPSMVEEKRTGKIVREQILPTRDPKGTHGQFRHIRMLKWIIESLGGNNFLRLKIGIGRPPKGELSRLE
jgi:hypothetical protein